MFLRCLSLCALVLLLTGCEREARRFDEAAAVSASPNPQQSSALSPGPAAVPETKQAPVLASPYEKNAFDIARGKDLFVRFNCNGCHAMGGGGMGPPLMDAKWRYGSDSRSIVETITYGRPNGMPAFGSKVSKQQIWQLAAYVRSMTGNVPKDAAPGRTDHMHPKPPEVMPPDNSR